MTRCRTDNLAFDDADGGAGKSCALDMDGGGFDVLACCIDATYSLEEAPKALEAIMNRKVKGKVVIDMEK